MRVLPPPHTCQVDPGSLQLESEAVCHSSEVWLDHCTEVQDDVEVAEVVVVDESTVYGVVVEVELSAVEVQRSIDVVQLMAGVDWTMN